MAIYRTFKAKELRKGYYQAKGGSSSFFYIFDIARDVHNPKKVTFSYSSYRPNSTAGWSLPTTCTLPEDITAMTDVCEILSGSVRPCPYETVKAKPVIGSASKPSDPGPLVCSCGSDTFKSPGHSWYCKKGKT
jgi:hypothetical protein